jgi:hypothetical protein
MYDLPPDGRSSNGDVTVALVVYAIMTRIWLETPIVNDKRFSQYIRLYKQFIHDIPESLAETT